MPGKAKKKRGARKYEQVGKVISDKAIKSPEFFPSEASLPKKPMHANRWHVFSSDNPVLEGELLSGPHANYRRNASYRLRTHDGEIVEFWGNKVLHALIKHGDCVGRWVKIEYVGSRLVRGYARRQKIYRLWIDKGTIVPKYSEVSKTKKKTKRK